MSLFSAGHQHDREADEQNINELTDKVAELEGKLSDMRDERDEWRKKANEEAERLHPLKCEIKSVTEAAMVIELDNHKLRGRNEMLNDQNVRLATAMQGVKDEREAAFSALEWLVDALTRGGDVLSALKSARAIVEKKAAERKATP